MGWVPLLRLLAAVPERGEAEAISLAFQSVQLMCSDFMSSLPPDQLRKCLEVAALYASQKVCRWLTSHLFLLSVLRQQSTPVQWLPRPT